jgi:hypothetical protein
MAQTDIPLGDTENVFFGTQEVETLIINGTTVWEKVTIPEDIDSDGTANSTDNTPALRLRGVRQSGGGVSWSIYAIFTNLLLTKAKIHVSGSYQFSGSLQDTETLSNQGSYKTCTFSASSMSNSINNYPNNYEAYVNYWGDLWLAYNSDNEGLTKAAWGEDHWLNYGLSENRFMPRYAYFRFPVSTDGTNYTDSQTIESIEVLIPEPGANAGDEISQYLNKYQQIINP